MLTVRFAGVSRRLGWPTCLNAQRLIQHANRVLALSYINAKPALRLFNVEAGYLAWIDCSELRVDNPHAFFEEADTSLASD